MTKVIPSCFEGFSCTAGACPDTCCVGWEVDLDEIALKKYRDLPGPLGEEVRSKIETEEGYTFFRMEGGRCPFLNERNLCRLILEAGEGCLSTTCREHPRFWEEYGDLQETCLAISCPEAARLLFSQPFRLTVTETEEPGEPDWELDELFLEELLLLRDEMFILAAEHVSISRRFANITALARQAQNQIEPIPMEECSTDHFLRAMESMEFTDDRLKTRLHHTLEHPAPADKVSELYGSFQGEGENLLLYFLYRYILRSVWDGYVWEKAQFSIHAVEAIFALAAAQDGDIRENLLWSAILFSREVEHSPDNLRLLQDLFSY